MALLMIDGYADLDPDGRPGLGAHAHTVFGVPVIGVANSVFRTATHAAPVVRGNSARPLYVTAAGMPRQQAAEWARRMAGRYRLPDASAATTPLHAAACFRHRHIDPTHLSAHRAADEGDQAGVMRMRRLQDQVCTDEFLIVAGSPDLPPVTITAC